MGQALDKAQEHEDGKTGTEAQIDNGNGEGGVEFQLVGGEGQGEHDHLEGDDHGEQAQVVENPGGQAVYPGNVPGTHGAEQKDQGNRQHSDDEAVQSSFQEGIVAEGHALDIVDPACEGFPVGQGEGLQVYKGVEFEGVHQHLKYRHQPDEGEDYKEAGKHLA